MEEKWRRTSDRVTKKKKMNLTVVYCVSCSSCSFFIGEIKWNIHVIVLQKLTLVDDGGRTYKLRKNNCFSYDSRPRDRWGSEGQGLGQSQSLQRRMQ